MRNTIGMAVLLALVLAVPFVSANEFTSTDFRVLDPVLLPSGYSTASGYQLWGSVSQITIGTSSATDFTVRSGFLYFGVPASPPPASPAPSPSAVLSGGAGIPLSLLVQKGVIARLITPPADLPQLDHKIAVCNTVDFYCDDVVGLKDLSAFFSLSAYAPAGNPADFNHDGRVDLADISFLFGHWSFRMPASFTMVAQTPRQISRGSSLRSKDTFIFGTPSGRIARQGIQGGWQAEHLGAVVRPGRSMAMKLLRYPWDAVSKAIRTWQSFWRGVK